MIVLQCCYYEWHSYSIKVFLKILGTLDKGFAENWHNHEIYIPYSLKLYTQFWVTHNLFNVFFCNEGNFRTCHIYQQILMRTFYMFSVMPNLECSITISVRIVKFHRWLPWSVFNTFFGWYLYHLSEVWYAYIW